ncbi:hypothetical protein HYH02_010378 [Chlamydomonas schloesseri]|uniref:PAS domain-containing protein n=1 Tax=Chlamydomonas schloesseri TaxID=2026947 RepID=A0A835W5T7_9CHLO|nr:hypothetical protein HYH02_010378 [Chlamydomonas schloesseri]|eukprot:KAG2440500.1 hypothetical protein HYH02_010378 [Chlamydomonas schloesseri]
MPKSQSTVSSFSSAPSRDSVASRLDHEGGGTLDLLDWGQGFMVGVFGVLFTIVKERYNTGIRWLLLKIALDFLQLFTVVFKPNDGWVIKQDLWLWKLLRMLQFDDFIKPRGYTIFLVALYIMIGLLVFALVLSAWVAWCFQQRSFPAVWPIKLLRVYANVFYQILDVATLTLLQLPFDCQWLGYPAAVRNHLALFPAVTCTSLQHLPHMLVAGVALVVYLLTACLNLMADFELNPTTRNLYATANSTVEVRAFCIKFLMTVVNYGIGWGKVQDVLLFMCSIYLTWMYLKWQPHLFGGVNHMRVGLNAAIALVSLGGCILKFNAHRSHEFRQHVTTITLALMGPIALVGAAASYLRLTLWAQYVLMRYRTAPPGQKARRIYKFQDAREVEIVARVCRKWTDQHYEVLDRVAVKEAEIVIKGGMQLFPASAYMAITYVNFLIDVLESTQTGNSQLTAAKKLNPNLMERFAIFAREQEYMQRSSGAKSGESSVDLVSYVEYQRSHKAVMRAHRAALVAIRHFWQLLLHNTVAFTSLAKALHRIEKSVSVAEGIYRAALLRYPSSPKLVRGYAKFLEAVKNNPWKAARYFNEADKLQEAQQQDEAALAVMGDDGEPGGGGLGGSAAHMLHRVDERINTVFLINSAGIIQMANKNACSLLGYGKGELDGKNINVIMPPPFSQRHNRYIRQYIQTGRERVISSVNTVVALHKNRYVIPVRLAVSKVSGATEDSIFMGVLEPIAADPGEAHVYLLLNGVVTAMDQAFAEWTGYGMTDILGKELVALVTDGEPLKAVLPKFDPVAVAKMQRDANTSSSGGGPDGSSAPTSPASKLTRGMTSLAAQAAAAAAQAAAATEAAATAGPESVSSLFFLHKYSRPVECSATLQRLGIGTEYMVEVTLRRTGPPHLLALTGPGGKIRYIASELARALGTSPSALYRQPLGDIMPQPWSTLHSVWIKSVTAMGPAAATYVSGVIGGAAAAAAAAAAGVTSRAGGSVSGVNTVGGSRSSAIGSTLVHGDMGGFGKMACLGAIGGAGGGSSYGGAFSLGGGGYGGALEAGTSLQVAPGSCRSGITTVLGSSLRQQGYYRLRITSNDDSGEMQHIVEATPSSRQEALSERRLVLTVDADGLVTEAEDAPTWLFGFSPQQLVGRSLADIVHALRPQPHQATGDGASAAAAAQGAAACADGKPAAEGDGAAAAPSVGSAAEEMSTTELLSLLISKAMMQSGVSWRVGVTAPMDEQELKALGPMRDAVLAKRTAAAIMEIEVSLDTGALQEEDGDSEQQLLPSAAAAAAAALGGSGGAAEGGSTKSGSGVPGIATPSLYASRAPTGTGLSVGGGTRPGSSLSVVPPSPAGVTRQGYVCTGNGMAPGGLSAGGGMLTSTGGGSDVMARLSAAGIQPMRHRASVLSQVEGAGGSETGGAADAIGEQAAVEGRPSAGAGGARGGQAMPRAPAGAKGRARRSSWIAVEGPGGGIMVVSGGAMQDATAAVAGNSGRRSSALNVTTAAAAAAQLRQSQTQGTGLGGPIIPGGVMTPFDQAQAQMQPPSQVRSLAQFFFQAAQPIAEGVEEEAEGGSGGDGGTPAAPGSPRSLAANADVQPVLQLPSSSRPGSGRPRTPSPAPFTPEEPPQLLKLSPRAPAAVGSDAGALLSGGSGTGADVEGGVDVLELDELHKELTDGRPGSSAAAFTSAAAAPGAAAPDRDDVIDDEEIIETVHDLISGNGGAGSRPGSPFAVLYPRPGSGLPGRRAVSSASRATNRPAGVSPGVSRIASARPRLGIAAGGAANGAAGGSLRKQAAVAAATSASRSASPAPSGTGMIAMGTGITPGAMLPGALLLEAEPRPESLAAAGFAAAAATGAASGAIPEHTAAEAEEAAAELKQAEGTAACVIGDAIAASATAAAAAVAPVTPPASVAALARIAVAGDDDGDFLEVVPGEPVGDGAAAGDPAALPVPQSHVPSMTSTHLPALQSATVAASTGASDGAAPPHHSLAAPPAISSQLPPSAPLQRQQSTGGRPAFARAASSGHSAALAAMAPDPSAAANTGSGSRGGSVNASMSQLPNLDTDDPARALILGTLLGMRGQGTPSSGPQDLLSSIGGREGEEALANALLPRLLGSGGADHPTESGSTVDPTGGSKRGTATGLSASRQDTATGLAQRPGAATDLVTAADVAAAFAQQQQDAEEDGDCSDLGSAVGDDARVVVIRVSLWRADFLSPVLEVDNPMNVTALAGEELSPPGLLLGVPTQGLVGQRLPDLLQLTERHASGLFQDPAAAGRRGGLKSAAKEGSKVGALREVTARHWDGDPLELSLQAVVKEGGPGRTLVVLKPRKPHFSSRTALLRTVSDLTVALKQQQEELQELLGHQEGEAEAAAAANDVRDVAALRRSSDGGATLDPLLSATRRSRHQSRAGQGNGDTAGGGRAGSAASSRSSGGGSSSSSGSAVSAGPFATASAAAASARSAPGAGAGAAAGPTKLEPSNSSRSLHQQQQQQQQQRPPLPPAPKAVAVSSLAKGPAAPLLSPAASAAALINTGGSSHFTLNAVGGLPPAAAAANRGSITAMSEATSDAPPSSKSSETDSFTGGIGTVTPIASPMVAVSPLTPSRRSYLEPRPAFAAKGEGGFGVGAPAHGGELQAYGSAGYGGGLSAYRASELGGGIGGGGNGGGGGGGGGYGAHRASEGGGGGAGGGGGPDGDGIDDAASDVSGVSGMSEAIDHASHIADYRRGKRYKKLLKVLESPVVQRAARDFTWQALLANVAQLLANALAFVLMTVLMAQQAASVHNLHAASQLNRRMHESFIILQKLNNIYEGLLPVGGYYTNSSIAWLTDELKTVLGDFADLNTEMYTGVGSNERPDPTTPYDPDNLQDVWNKPIRQETIFYTNLDANNATVHNITFKNSTLWDLANTYIERASEVQHMHRTWGPAHGTLSDWDAYKWVVTNGLLPLYEGMSDALLRLTHTAIAAAEEVNRLQLVLLILQGGVICALLLLYMWWLQRRVSQQRYNLYSLFMLVPVGLLRALASKSVTVADNSDHEASSDDEEEKQHQENLQQHAQLLQQDRMHGGSGGGGGGEDGSGATGSKAFNNTINLLSLRGREANANSAGGLWNRFRAMLGVPPKNKVAPAGEEGKAAGGKRGGGRRDRDKSSSNAPKRRHLVPSNHDSISLLTPFVVWGVLICILYTVGFVVLRDVRGPMSLISTHNVAVVRMHRVIYYSLHLASQSNDTAKELLRPVLSAELQALEREWGVVLYGANETLRADRRFRLSYKNTAFNGQRLSFLQFRVNRCLEQELAGSLAMDIPAIEEGVCLTPNSSFYAATSHGVGFMVDRFLEDGWYMARLPPASIDINSTHLRYIAEEGQGNVELGMDTVADSLLATVQAAFKRVELLQIFSLVVSWLLAAVFIFLQLRPFVASNRVETQRIARMLSELPPDVDIEGLVTKVLLATGNAGRGGGAAAAAATAHAVAAAGTSGGEAGGSAALRGAPSSPPATPPGGGVSAAMVLRSIWGPSSPPANANPNAAPAEVTAGANDGSVRRGKKA